MKNRRLSVALILVTLATFAGCNFIGAVFRTGVGVGVFVVVALLVIVLMISRSGRRGV